MRNFKTINLEDVIQVIIGASALSVPIAFSEESWGLSRTLPSENIVFLVILSFIFINLYSFQIMFQANIRYRIFTFLSRALFEYILTVITVFIVLYALNRMPLLTEPVVAIKRIIIVSFPASMGAVVVDSFDKE